MIKTKKSLGQILEENIINFWYPEVIDTQNGGYRLNHDSDGKWQGPANKRLVTQARTVWFFSRLVNSAYGNSDYLKAATHGYEFLRDRMWDKEFGGFYWEVDTLGQTATIPNKQMYGQAFGLYALAEYVTASGDPGAMVAAKELFDLVETRAHDEAHGGYREVLRRDWSRAPEPPKDLWSIKRMNTHIHLMEAITKFFALTREPLARERLIELIFINSNAVVRKTIGACTDRYLETWEPLRESEDVRVSYGHDVENVWLLAQACAKVGISNSLLMDLYKVIFNYALQYGYDHRDGGFYYSGPFNTRADRREKIWWVQAEGLVGALWMYRLTGEIAYWDCFSKTLQWIINHQADWKRGDWHQSVTPNGKPAGVKSGPWKGPYHNGRAMLQCLDLLALGWNERSGEGLS